MNSIPTRAVLDLNGSNATRCYSVTNREPIGATDHPNVTAEPNKKLYRANSKTKNSRKPVRRGKMADVIEEFLSIDLEAAFHHPLSAQEKVDVFYETILDIMDTN